MALTLIKEDGTGRADANAYAAVADGDAYHEGHLYATAWTGATPDQKAAALVMATRVLDAAYQFQGLRSVAGQARQWPRTDCPDPDAGPEAVLAGDAVPPAVVAATCELGRELLVADRTAAPPGEGIARQHNADYSETVYSKTDVRPMVPHLVQALLAKYGQPVTGRPCTLKLQRS